MLQNAVVCYLMIALAFFKVWLEAFWGDATTPKTNCISWAALMLAPLLWPIVVPLLKGRQERLKSRLDKACGPSTSLIISAFLRRK